MRSLKISVDCQVRSSPAWARWCTGQEEMSRPSKVTRPDEFTNPVSASTHVVFPAPFGPISPTSWPGVRLEVEFTDRVYAAERRRRARPSAAAACRFVGRCS